jgi:hypothetical protein
MNNRCDTCRTEDTDDALMRETVSEDGMTYTLILHKDQTVCESRMEPRITIDDLNEASRAALMPFESPPPYTFAKARELGLID